MTVLFYAVTLVFLGMTVATLVHLRWVRRLPSLRELTAPANENRILCSVVVAARNEEARIENTIRHLLGQNGVSVEIIAVDDRSTDGTGAILARLAQEDSRLRVIRIEVLPDGWLGKCHACHIGASAATGEWILFTDGDCWLTRDMISRAVRLAERDGVDHVTLTSSLAPKSFGLEASHLAFLISLANWFSAVNRDRPRAYLGIGAFNLVRAAAYRQCGGYEALRLTVLDDMKLGLLLRRAGKRTRGFLGGDDVECHWGNTVGSMIKILEKNYFAALEFRLWLALLGSAFVAFLLCALVLGLISGTAAGLAAVLSPLSLILPATILARRIGCPWRSAMGVPFMLPLFVYTLLNSTFVTLRQGGVRWRDTFYSIEALRAGGVR